MGKAGRKRKIGAKRYPDGTVHRHEDVRCVVVGARQRQYGYGKKRALEPWAGFEIGRLALAGHFGSDHEAQKVLDIVKDYVEAATAYLRLKSPQYPLPKAMDYMSGRGASLNSDPSNRQVQAVVDRYQALVDRLAKVDGLDRIAFHEVAFHDRSCGANRIQAVKDCVLALRGA